MFVMRPYRFATASSTLLDNLLHYYNFDETSGNLLDQVGSNNGTVNGATQNVSGKIGTAYNFDGVNDLVTFDSRITISGDFSIAFWFNNDNLSTRVISKNDGLSFIRARETATTIRVGFNTNTAFGGFATMSNNVWYHCIVTREGSNTRVYVNNVESTDGAKNAGTVDITWDQFSDSANPFNGELDEVGIWDRVLTSGERAELYNSGTGKTHPFT